MVLCCAVVTMLMQLSCMRDSYLVKISDSVSIGDQWVEFRPDTALKADKDVQLLLLDLALPFKDDFYGEGKGVNRGKGILTVEGDVVNPDIQIIDQYGNPFVLVYSGSRGMLNSKGSPVYGLREDELPRDREYTLIRMKSAKPIKCNAVYWFCESSRDLK